MLFQKTRGLMGDQVVEKLAWVVLLEGQMGSWLSTNRFVNCELKGRHQPMVWLVWIGKEGLCLLGAFPWGGSSVDERGVLFLRILFLLNGRRGAGSGEVSLGGESGWGVGLQRSECETFGKRKKEEKSFKRRCMTAQTPPLRTRMFCLFLKRVCGFRAGLS